MNWQVSDWLARQIAENIAKGRDPLRVKLHDEKKPDSAGDVSWGNVHNAADDARRNYEQFVHAFTGEHRRPIKNGFVGRMNVNSRYMRTDHAVKTRTIDLDPSQWRRV